LVAVTLHPCYRLQKERIVVYWSAKRTVLRSCWECNVAGVVRFCKIFGSPFLAIHGPLERITVEREILLLHFDILANWKSATRCLTWVCDSVDPTSQEARMLVVCDWERRLGPGAFAADWADRQATGGDRHGLAIASSRLRRRGATHVWYCVSGAAADTAKRSYRHSPRRGRPRAAVHTSYGPRLKWWPRLVR
jgi:hypothetical protein